MTDASPVCNDIVNMTNTWASARKFSDIIVVEVFQTHHTGYQYILHCSGIGIYKAATFRSSPSTQANCTGKLVQNRCEVSTPFLQAVKGYIMFGSCYTAIKMSLTLLSAVSSFHKFHSCESKVFPMKIFMRHRSNAMVFPSQAEHT